MQCTTFATSEKARASRCDEECPGLCPKIAHLLTQPHGHLLCATETSEKEGLVFCARCGAYASSNPRSLRFKCKGNARKPTAGFYTLRRLAGGCHPVHSCKATIGKIVPLNGVADADELRHLEERLEEISRTGKVKAQRGGHLIPSAAEPAPGNSAGTGSTAKDKLCALRQRIQLKELALQQHSGQEARGCQGVPEHSGNSQLPLML